MKEREILHQLQPHTNLKKLSIQGFSGIGFSDWMGDQSFSSIVELGLFHFAYCRSLWPLEQLPSLKTKTINWDFFFSNISSMTKPFRSLQVFTFRIHDRVAEWLFREGVVVFPTLKELQLSICPNLEELVILNCREQELILEGGLPSSLERIAISKCHNLKALDNNSFRLLTSLQKLEIRDCKELQCLRELPSYPFDSEIRECPLLNSCSEENGEDWLKIKHAQLKLIYFSPGILGDSCTSQAMAVFRNNMPFSVQGIPAE